ncbi:hypothetical protein ACI3PL_23010, partial [Lacticaseibacillus paracasei]
DSNVAMPVSNPLLYNLSILGPGFDAPVGARQMRGGVFRRGTHGRIFNAIFTGWPSGGIDLRDPATIMATMGATPGLTLENSIVTSSGPAG